MLASRDPAFASAFAREMSGPGRATGRLPYRHTGHLRRPIDAAPIGHTELPTETRSGLLLSMQLSSGSSDKWSKVGSASLNRFTVRRHEACRRSSRTPKTRVDDGELDALAWRNWRRMLDAGWK